MEEGLLENFCLLGFPNFTLLTRHTDLILNQMVSANFFVVFSREVPQILEAFGLNCVLDEAGYKVLYYFHSVVRRASCSTTVLGSFQATQKQFL